FFHPPSHTLHLRSFPTRRSSDLYGAGGMGTGGNGAGNDEAGANGVSNGSPKPQPAIVAPASYERIALAPKMVPRDTPRLRQDLVDRNSTRLNSSHDQTSYAVFCL